MSNRKLHAELLRIGILAGYIESEEAVAWADALIDASDTAPADLIDVSLAAGKHYTDVAHALAQVVGDVHEAELSAALLRHMANVYFSQPQHGRKIARALYDLALQQRAPSPRAEMSMLTFDDAYDLADAGIFSTPEGVDAELRDSLAEWRFHE